MSCTSQGRSQHGISLASPAGLSRALRVLRHFPIISATPLSQRRSYWKELGVESIFKPVLQLHLTNHDVHLAMITPRRKHFGWLQQHQMKINGCYWSMGRGTALTVKLNPGRADIIHLLPFLLLSISVPPSWLPEGSNGHQHKEDEAVGRALLAQHPS